MFIISLLISGCRTNSGYQIFFAPETQQRFAPTRYVQIYKHTEEGLKELLNNGYFIIGRASFNGPLEPEFNALHQARTVGADIVMLDTQFSHTEQGMTVIPEYHPSVHYNIHYTHDGRICSCDYYYRWGHHPNMHEHVVVSSHTVYRPVPYRVDSYKQNAVFLRKKYFDEFTVENEKKEEILRYVEYLKSNDYYIIRDTLIHIYQKRIYSKEIINQVIAMIKNYRQYPVLDNLIVDSVAWGIKVLGLYLDSNEESVSTIRSLYAPSYPRKIRSHAKEVLAQNKLL